MRDVNLKRIFNEPIVLKYLRRSGVSHAIAVAYHAYNLAVKYHVNPDLATKAALLHDIGHYTWYTNGKWDYTLYKENDIHAIKGAERAHKLLLKLGEDPHNAKEIALAILLHTDSYLPFHKIERTPLQKVVHIADTTDEEPGGNHHYRHINIEKASDSLARLDQLVEQALKNTNQTYQSTKIIL